MRKLIMIFTLTMSILGLTVAAEAGGTEPLSVTPIIHG